MTTLYGDGKIIPLDNPRGHNIPEIIMPKFWYQVGKDSDAKGVKQRMSVIPEHLRQDVADNYDNLFLSGPVMEGRRKANKYLHDLASLYLKKQP